MERVKIGGRSTLAGDETAVEAALFPVDGDESIVGFDCGREIFKVGGRESVGGAVRDVMDDRRATFPAGVRGTASAVFCLLRS